jgi:hypothetical protein
MKFGAFLEGVPFGLPLHIASDNTTIPEHYDMCSKPGTMNKQSTSQSLNENIVCGDKAEQTTSHVLCLSVGCTSIIG